MDGVDAPADGVVTGYGKVDGRLTAVSAYDFTVMAGSMGMTGEFKVTRLRELALTKRIPFVWLLDSAGARVQEAAGAMFAGSGHLFREEVIMSGVIPQVAALLGRARPAPPTSPAWLTSCRWSRAAARWRSPVPTWCAPRWGRTSPRRN